MNKEIQISNLIPTEVQGMVELHVNICNLCAKKISVDKDGTPVEVSKKHRFIHTTYAGVLKKTPAFESRSHKNEVLHTKFSRTSNTVKLKVKDVSLFQSGYIVFLYEKNVKSFSPSFIASEIYLLISKIMNYETICKRYSNLTKRA